MVRRLLSIGAHEGDLGQRAALHPLIEDSRRPWAVRAAPAVELLDEDGQDAPALRRVDDDRGRRREVGDDAVLEVEVEPRVGGQVGQPVAGLGPGDPAQVDVVAQPVEDDLDPPRLARTPARGGDIDRAVLERRGGIDGQRPANVLSHLVLPR